MADSPYLSGHLPIIDDFVFDWIKVTAIPERIHDNKFVIRDVPADILGINFDQQLYYRTSNDSFRRSLKVDERTYITKLNTLLNKGGV